MESQNESPNQEIIFQRKRRKSNRKENPGKRLRRGFPVNLGGEKKKEIVDPVLDPIQQASFYTSKSHKSNKKPLAIISSNKRNDGRIIKPKHNNNRKKRPIRGGGGGFGGGGVGHGIKKPKKQLKKPPKKESTASTPSSSKKSETFSSPQSSKKKIQLEDKKIEGSLNNDQNIFRVSRRSNGV